VVEVHISNIYNRESIRQHSMTAEACIGVISGLGLDGYVAALKHLAKLD
jgi:3-dehydroquinate dehydratase-2